MRVMWAYNKQDPYITEGKLKLPYHWEFRGVRRAYLRSPQQSTNAPTESENVKYWDVRMENVSFNNIVLLDILCSFVVPVASSCV